MIQSSEQNAENVLTKTNIEGPKFENQLRPQILDDYIGQSILKKNLKVSISAAKNRNEVFDHVLLHGAPGLGKTTLANIIAHELSANLRITTGPALEKTGDLVSIISNLKKHDVLFIDEIHRLKPAVEEVLYTAMEDFAVDIVIGKGPSARTMRINLEEFTLIGATTKISMLSSPLRDRFGSVYALSPYKLDEIKSIILRSSSILDSSIDEDAALALAKCARFTPRIANRLLRRVRDYTDYFKKERIDMHVLNTAFENLGIDSLGLDTRDRDILLTIMDNYNGGPVGLSTLSASINEEQATLEDVYEPYLIQLGFLERTHRGRKVTDKAYRHLNKIKSS